MAAPTNEEKLLATYADAARARGMAQSTLTNHINYLRLFFRFLTECEIDDPLRVTAGQLEDFRLELVKTPTEAGLPRRAGTLNNALSAVKTFYRLLYESDLISYNPSKRLELIRVPRRLPPPVASEAEVAKLLESIDASTPHGARDRALCELLYATGARAREMLMLDVDDLNLDERLCHIRHGKGGKQRVVPFGALAASHLENYLRWVRPALARGRSVRALFLSPWGYRMTYQKMRERFAGHVRASGLTKRVTMHGLRHACATHLLERHADLRHIQELLGHASVVTTQIYTHLSIKHLKETLLRCHPRERTDEK